MWRGDLIFKLLYPRLYALETCKSITVADKLGHENLVYSFRRHPRVVIVFEQSLMMELEQQDSRLTCFSPQAHTFVPECNQVVAALDAQELEEIPVILKEAEAKTYILQYRFGQRAKPGNPAFVLTAAFHPSSPPMLTLPEAITPPSTATLQQIISSTQEPTEKLIESSSTKNSNQEMQTEAENKTTKTMRQLFPEEETARKKPRQPMNTHNKLFAMYKPI
nr:RNA-directed DNA polymerase, eukaryota, reverse transcriptase zinc-binding domain protein [Tanacetum cinerariifolium]